jgi:UDP-N-acetylmuramoylalanine--D-glutamate ligase
MPSRELAAIVPAAEEKSIPVWGEIELFAQALTALKEERAYAPKIIAITGTNGKTTVTSLTGLLCRRAGLTVEVAGNISPAALDRLCEVLDEDHCRRHGYWNCPAFSCTPPFRLQADVATVLNISAGSSRLAWRHGWHMLATRRASSVRTPCAY